eukprot:gnl/TRDRNA2_/TRDRNA2_163380_c0_seq3.p1 gnl/TRDRNA2_/TRDRNA2_163380_c0~~gnl/TRDRNA2_/TRDRNA2_163380_c0_seq3.p1  ORF type:complete len:131 (-),score=25.69 gnl/TRDRNA2_/TRDRNA2_163380_c0_seq3:44-400(-)
MSPEKNVEDVVEKRWTGFARNLRKHQARRASSAKLPEGETGGTSSEKNAEHVVEKRRTGFARKLRKHLHDEHENTPFAQKGDDVSKAVPERPAKLTKVEGKWKRKLCTGEKSEIDLTM